MPFVTPRVAKPALLLTSRLSEYYLALARDLDVMEAKLPEDVYKTHLVGWEGEGGREGEAKRGGKRGGSKARKGGGGRGEARQGRGGGGTRAVELGCVGHCSVAVPPLSS